MMVAGGLAGAALWMGVCTASMMIDLAGRAKSPSRLAQAAVQPRDGAPSAAVLAAEIERRHAALALLLADASSAPGAAQALTPPIALGVSTASDPMRRLQAVGCRSVGLELDPALARRARESGLAVARAYAEQLPIRTASVDGVVCKVVIPYTEESAAIAEIARVLPPGGTARISYHGLGYFLRYLLADRNWKVRVYGLRSIVNTLVFAMTSRRLPGFLGDTLYQSERRLRRYYEANGLDLIEVHPSPSFAGAPVFIYHVLRRR